VVIHDGDTETFGRMVCESVEPDQTRIFVSADIPWLTDPEASDRLATMIQGTADNIKKLIETET
jgi:hypothetical protein